MDKVEVTMSDPTDAEADADTVESAPLEAIRFRVDGLAQLLDPFYELRYKGLKLDRLTIAPLGNVDITVISNSEGWRIMFPDAKPDIRVRIIGRIWKRGTLTGLDVTRKQVKIKIVGLPDITLDA